jgi:hypothetical protein
MKNPAILWHQIDAAIYKFLLVEADIGLTFAQAAIHATCTEECLHCRGIARQSYDVAQKGMHRGHFSKREAKNLCGKLKRLRRALEQSGDPGGFEDCR